MKFSFSKLFTFVGIVYVLLVVKINSNLIGIDLGSEFFKATILRPGRPFTMMENIQSKTKTPTAIALKDDERVFGADAIAKKPRIPKQALVFFHEYLGKKYSDPEVKKFVEKFFVSYDMEEDQDRGSVKIKINFNKEEFTFSPEEIFGMLFRYIKYLADKFSNSDIKDCVVTVPNFYGYKERQALAQAVEMSKLNLLGFVTENVAAAVHFSQSKQFNSTENYIFYNMGSSYTQATLVSFLSNFTTKNNKTVESSKTLTVLGESWDQELGGNSLNYNLIRNLMNRFDNMPQRKGKSSISGDYRVAERILPAAIKYKEILSANKETPVTVLSVDSGMNLETRLTREEFENANQADFERAYDPIERLLNSTGLGLDSINAIELIGGSVRVPKIQEVLRNKLGDHSNLLGTHMNGDDSMAFGAAYICANFSSNFKGGKIQLYHGPNYEVRLKLTNLEEAAEDSSSLPYCEDNSNSNTTELAFNCIRKLDKNTTLYRLRKGLDSARTVSFKHDGDIRVELLQKFENSENEELLITYNITGVRKALEKMKNENVNTLPKLHLRFKQNYMGLFSLKADLSYDLTLYLGLQSGPTGGQEVLYTPTFTAPLSEEEIKAYEEELNSKNLTQSAKTTLLNMRKDVGKKMTREEKVNLEVAEIHTQPRPLTKEEIKSAKEKLDKLDQIDSNRIRTMEKRNSLESLIYNKRDWLQSEQAPVYAKDQTELETVTKTLNEISEWYDEDGYSANFEALNSKFNTLAESFKPFETRISRHLKREKTLESFHSEFKKYMEEATALLKNKPWVENHFNNTFTKEVNSIKDWINEHAEKQSKLAHHEDPILHADVIETKIQSVRREFHVLSRIPKPKPVVSKDNPKIEDLIKNGTSIEDLIKKANLTAEDFEKIMKNFTNTNTTSDSNETNNTTNNGSQEKPDL